MAGIKLLGFKDRSEIAFEDNIKHSQFIYPDEMVSIIVSFPTSRLTHTQAYSGSKRTFSALLKSMVKKDKIGLVLSLSRRNSSPTFCALLPQVPPIFHRNRFEISRICRRRGLTMAVGMTQLDST